MDTHGLVVIGKVAKPFGVRGEIKAHSFTASIEPFQRSTRLFLDDEPFTVKGVRPHQGAVLLMLAGIESPEKVKTLAGRLIRTEAANFPPIEDDEYYLHELIGAEVRDTAGTLLGRVTRLIETGANDVLEIHGPLGEILLPLIESVVPDVDLEAGVITVDPPDGLIPDA